MSGAENQKEIERIKAKYINWVLKVDRVTPS